MNYHLQEIGVMKGNDKEHIRTTWNQSEAGRKNTSQMKWSLSWQAGDYIKAILANFKKNSSLSARGENIASDSMLALLDFCEDAMTPFVGFLKNDLGTKQASSGKLCKLDHQWEQMDCEIPMFPSPPGIYLYQPCPHFCISILGQDSLKHYLPKMIILYAVKEEYLCKSK